MYDSRCLFWVIGSIDASLMVWFLDFMLEKRSILAVYQNNCALTMKPDATVAATPRTENPLFNSGSEAFLTS